MTRRKWMLATGVGVSAGAAGLLLEPWKGTSMRMTAVEKLFVNSPGHAAGVAGHAESLLDRIEVQPGWRYLDVGCGVGATARRVAETRSLSVVGVDIDPEQIEAARASGALSNLQFEVMDATGLAFGDEEFDIVATSKTTHYIPSYERALVEMVRVLRPGGVLGLHGLDRSRLARNGRQASVARYGIPFRRCTRYVRGKGRSELGVSLAEFCAAGQHLAEAAILPGWAGRYEVVARDRRLACIACRSSA